MELGKLEEISIDKVCRTCLTSGNDEELMISLTDDYDLISETFLITVPVVDNLPNRLCNECHDIIRKAFEFKKQCIKSTSILLPQDEYHLNEEYDDQTNSKFISLQEMDTIYETPAIDQINSNPLSVFNPKISNSQHDEQEDEIVKCDTIEEANTKKYSSSSSNVDEDDRSQTKPDEDYEALEISNDGDNEHVDQVEMENLEDEQEEGENISSKRNHHQCEKCNKSFTRATHLKRHLLTHEETKQIQCSVCMKGFHRIDQLNLHMQSNHHHSETKPFQCTVPDCKKGFIKEDYLKKHIEAKHSDSPKEKEICSQCQKTFSSKKYLRSHMKVHTAEKISLKKDPNNEKPYLCSECGLRFVRNDYLVIHMRRHLGVKPYKCKFCDKGFPRSTDLVVHERYHTQEKSHLCNLCGKGFQRAYNLLVHMRVHTGERPYSCSYCSKSFSQGNDLKAHIRRHTGERFKCEICLEGFIQGYHLTHHKRTVHGLDVKSHIRRVEKFVVNQSPQSSSASAFPQTLQTQDIPNTEQIKIESDFQVNS